MTEPLVSILIPAYNVEPYLRECLDSIVNQTYQELQVVIVDDGSTDSTPQICDGYKAKYSFVEVYHIPNGGVANARNVLLSKAKGAYILFVDSDDWIEPDMIESLVFLAERDDLDITICGKKIETDIKPISQCVSEPPNISCQWNQKEGLKKFIRHEEINGSLWNKLIKSELLNDVLFDPAISYGEDALVIWEVLQKASHIGVTSHPFYHHRINDESISHGKFGQKIMSSHFVWQKFATDTALRYPELHPMAKANAAVADFWLLYFASLDNYPHDKNIAEYRHNLKKHLHDIWKMKLLSPSKYVVAYGLAYSYSAAGCMIRQLRKTHLL
ncbi:MAG: glycosyltransferase family 2 protein [Bacteroidales bacterium]|nr:glycosyltransferase family 2 protein [Bacteroidales bacterium]